MSRKKAGYISSRFQLDFVVFCPWPLLRITERIIIFIAVTNSVGLSWNDRSSKTKLFIYILTINKDCYMSTSPLSCDGFEYTVVSPISFGNNWMEKIMCTYHIREIGETYNQRVTYVQLLPYYKWIIGSNYFPSTIYLTLLLL